MRVFTRNQIVDLLSTLLEAIQYIDRKNYTSSYLSIIDDCFLALNSLEMNFKSSLSEKRFKYYQSLLFGIKRDISNIEVDENNHKVGRLELDTVLNYIKEMIIEVQNESEVKLEILFIPYKYAMWDSLESVWLSAHNDTKCNALVLPIPYYERNSQGFLRDFKYEGQIFLDNNIPIISDKDYNIKERKPDIIYYHNPYDDENIITSVAPEFYTEELKIHAGLLVYIPYFISGPYQNSMDAKSFICNKGVNNADKVILQSNVLKEIYVENGVEPEKLLVLGSPKTDAALRTKDQIKLPIEWVSKILNKKVVLLNSTIKSLLENTDYMKTLRERIEIILNHPEIILIWRPHPLLHATIKTMRPQYEDCYSELEDLVKESHNSILDETEDESKATFASDGLISEYSSLINTYILSEKPVLILDMGKDLEDKYLLSSNIFSCYFEEEVNLEEFLHVIITNNDKLLYSRVNTYKKSIENTDGMCGMKTHQQIYNLFLDECY